MSYVQVQQRPPPPASLSTAQAKRPQEVLLPQLWETLPAENRRRLSQIVARVIARHSLLRKKEVPDD